MKSILIFLCLFPFGAMASLPQEPATISPLTSQVQAKLAQLNMTLDEADARQLQDRLARAEEIVRSSRESADASGTVGGDTRTYGCFRAHVFLGATYASARLTGAICTNLSEVRFIGFKIFQNVLSNPDSSGIGADLNLGFFELVVDNVVDSPAGTYTCSEEKGVGLYIGFTELKCSSINDNKRVSLGGLTGPSALLTLATNSVMYIK